MPEPAHRPKPIHTHAARRRRCLTCGHDFDSAWAGERVCPVCKNSDAFATATGLPEQFSG